jgi:hypothetical protein
VAQSPSQEMDHVGIIFDLPPSSRVDWAVFQ